MEVTRSVRNVDSAVELVQHLSSLTLFVPSPPIGSLEVEPTM
jgi:hypothetical protein